MYNKTKELSKKIDFLSKDIDEILKKQGVIFLDIL